MMGDQCCHQEVNDKLNKKIGNTMNGEIIVIYKYQIMIFLYIIRLFWIYAFITHAYIVNKHYSNFINVVLKESKKFLGSPLYPPFPLHKTLAIWIHFS